MPLGRPSFPVGLGARGRRNGVTMADTQGLGSLHWNEKFHIFKELEVLNRHGTGENVCQ
jgi:hypothetical protein